MNDLRNDCESYCSSSRLFVGQDSHGNWVVQDQAGMNGGLFVGRAEALRFAIRENHGRWQAVTMVPGVFELGAIQVANDAGSPPRRARAAGAAAHG